MPTITLLVGIPGAGKSTYTNHTNAIVISRDTYRFRLLKSIITKIYYRRDIEPFISKIELFSLRYYMRKGRDIIVDECNVDLHSRQRYYDLAIEYGYDVTVVHFPNHKKAYSQNERRDRKVPIPVLQRFQHNYEHVSTFERCIALNQQFILREEYGN